MGENAQVIVDAGEALAGGEAVTTTNTDTQETLSNLKTVPQEEETKTDSAQEGGDIDEDSEDNGTDDEKKKFDAPKPEEEKNDDGEEKEENGEDDENDDSDSDEEEDDDEEDDDSTGDIAYIKNNPEAILKLIQELQKSNFQNKWKKKYELEIAEKQELEKKYLELQKQKYADKYDDANLPVLENKRPFWRAQNKFYESPDNEALRQAYIIRLQEELDDIKLTGKTVSIDDKESSKPEPKAVDNYNTFGRIGVKIQQPRR